MIVDLRGQGGVSDTRHVGDLVIVSSYPSSLDELSESWRNIPPHRPETGSWSYFLVAPVEAKDTSPRRFRLNLMYDVEDDDAVWFDIRVWGPWNATDNCWMVHVNGRTTRSSWAVLRAIGPHRTHVRREIVHPTRLVPDQSYDSAGLAAYLATDPGDLAREIKSFQEKERARVAAPPPPTANLYERLLRDDDLV